MQPDGFPDLVQKKLAVALRIRRGKRLRATPDFDFVHNCDSGALEILRKDKLEALVETLHDRRAGAIRSDTAGAQMESGKFCSTEHCRSVALAEYWMSENESGATSDSSSLPPHARALRAQEDALWKLEVRRADVIVVGTLRSDLAFPWLYSWNERGHIASRTSA